MAQVHPNMKRLSKNPPQISLEELRRVFGRLFELTATLYRRWLSLALLWLLVLSACQKEPTAISGPPATPPAATATRRPPTATPTATPTSRTVPTPTPVPSPPTPTPTITPTPAVLASEEEPLLIPWQEAAQHIGQQVTVEGTIVRTYKSRKATVFLNFDPDYRHTLSLVIFPDDASKFPGPPEEIYRGRTVRVTGEIKEYKGAPEIIVRTPEQLEIISEEAEPAPPTATPVPLVEGIVDWRDAAHHYGQRITVEGTIVRTKNTGKVIFLNFDPDYRHTLTLVIFPEDAAKFPGPPEEMFLHRRLRATGVVQEYKGAPEIIIRDPEQIEIIE